MPEDIIAKDMADGENFKRPAKSRERKLPKRISERYLYNSGLAYLQRFPTSTANFRKVMLRKIDRSCKAHPDQEKPACMVMLDAVQATFQRMGLLNDDQYMTGMVTSLRRRGLSTNAITAKLAAKGLTREAISETLADNASAATQNPELSAAVLFARRKRLGPFRRTEDTANDKELAAMGRAGFGLDIAQQVLRLSAEEAQDICSNIN